MMNFGLRLTGELLLALTGSVFSAATFNSAGSVICAGLLSADHSKNWSLALRKASGVFFSPTIQIEAPLSRNLRHK